MILTLEDKKFLVKISRDTLWAKLTNEELPVYYKDKELYRKSFGLFIKLLLKKKIRAYSGVLSDKQDLIASIQKITSLAAFNDFRFSPVKKEEYNDIKIQIIIIEDIIGIKTLTDLNIGEDGLMIKSEVRQSIVLPWDVPEEYLEKEFVNTAFLQAGLDKNDINKVELFRIKCELVDETKLDITPIV